MKPETSSASLITCEAVIALCGGVSNQTIWRWRRDPRLNFPKAIVIRDRLYWREAEITNWLLSQEASSESAA
jgi:predicted DNA-binding transcriptional regulator AlpA